MTNFIQPKVENKNTFLVYYQGILAVAAILIFFTKLSVYLEYKGIGIPLLWIIAFMVASIPLLINIPKRFNCIPISIVIWCGGYLAMPLISILIMPQYPDLQILEDIIRSMIFLLLMSLIFLYHPLVTRWVKRTILFVTIANVLMFIYEFFNPVAFYLEQHAAGRASGLYGNSNAASSAAIVGLIFSIDLIKPKYRIFYALFVLMGIIATFSRSGMIAWLLAILLFLALNIIPRYQLPLLFLSSFIFLSIVSTQVNNLAYLKSANGTYLFTEDSLARVSFLIDPLGQDDDSKTGRLGYVDESLTKFNRNPLIGNGLGSGKNPSHISARGTAQRSHNIYLDQMIEYGFLGFFVYPLLLLASVWKVQGEMKKYATVFLAVLSAYGIFSHTLLSSFPALSFYAVMGSLTKKSYLEDL